MTNPPKDSTVPRWLALTAEADYWAWVIEEMYAKAQERSPLDSMIDNATGYDGVLLKEAKYAIAQFERCRKELTELNDLERNDD